MASTFVCAGPLFCDDMTAALSGRNVTGFIVEEGRVFYKKTRNQKRALQVHFCPFCGQVVPGAERTFPARRVERTKR